MRTIKFRGFQKSWIYGGISIFENEATIYDINCVANSAYEVDLKSVGQFSGFTDKKNTEIYENDIVKYHKNTSKWLVSFTGQIVFHQGSFCLYWKREMLGKIEEHYDLLSKLNLMNVKVLTNIYEQQRKADAEE